MNRTLVPGLIAALFLVTSVVSQITIESARWGFDGKSVLGGFNLLTIKVRNDSARLFEGIAKLENRGGGLASVGAEQVVPCILAPGNSRFVQFFPFVAAGSEEWQMTVGKTRMKFGPHYGNAAGQRVVTEGLPATVYLRATDSLEDRGVGLPAFPEERFPPSVSGTFGLARVVLDHVPEFQTPQRIAFLDWLRGGGELHIGQSGGSYPTFAGNLEVLNDPSDSFAVGAGRVTRHARSFGRGDPISGLRSRSAKRNQNLHESVAIRVLRELRQIVRPDHEWWLIYLVIFGFFLAVVPWHAWFSIKRVGYLGSIGSLLAIVAVCTWLLFVIGRRGYGEESAVHSLSYAKQLAPGRFDVVQFKNVFSTTSRRHAIRHRASGSLYATAERNESVPGRILNGPDARFQVAIPLFTSRPFVHRGVFTGDPLPIELAPWSATSGLRGFSCTWNGPEVIAGLAFHGRDSVELHWSGATLEATGGLRKVAARLKGPEDNYNAYMGYSQFGARVDAIQVVQNIFRWVVAERWGISLGAFGGSATDADSVRLILLCRSSDDLKIRKDARGSAVGNEDGFVIYDVTMRKGG